MFVDYTHKNLMCLRREVKRPFVLDEQMGPSGRRGAVCKSVISEFSFSQGGALDGRVSSFFFTCCPHCIILGEP
jgi:hypothetical protein